MNIMTYYWKKGLLDMEDTIIARRYKTSRGYIFDIGTAFEDKYPATTLRGFFETRHTICETKKDVLYMERELRKQYPNAEIYTTEEEYR